MKKTDARNFAMDIIKEFDGQLEKGHLKVVSRDTISAGQQVLPTVWATRCKRDIVTNQVTKYKARMNAHGGKNSLASTSLRHMHHLSLGASSDYF